MNKWLPGIPSRKIIVFLVFVIISISGYFLISNFDKYKTYSFENNDLSIKKILKNNDKDSDNDGLKDWEEDLWKTDLNNPDTDGDGTNDGDEVEGNRDPLIAGPDDYFSQSNVIEERVKERIKSVNETDEIARELMTNFIGLKESDYLNKETQDLLVQSVVEKQFNTDYNYSNNYNSDNLNLVESEELSLLIKYKNDLKNILLKGEFLGDDIQILAEYIMSNNDGEVETLNNSLNIYKEIQTDLIKMDVPTELKDNHLEVVNLIDQVITDVTKMKFFYTDPVGALTSLKRSQTNKELIINKLVEIGTYLQEKGV